MSPVIFLLCFVSLSTICLSGVEARETQTWCDPILGCLELTDAWYSGDKPLNVIPEDRAKINTQFILQTREEPGLETDVFIYADDLSSITSSTFDPTRPTKFIIHGFIDDGFVKWIKEFSEAFLGHDDYNVIRVDWGGGSKFGYIVASANIRVVGLEIAHMVNNLIGLYGLDPTTVHVLGHSLGSHAAGHAGEGITNLGRITGLDPAGPGFTNTETFIRLDPSDAIFVDNIHTDADTIFLLGLGTKQPMGNIAFYPNGGHQQPGCGFFSFIDFWNWVNGIRDIVACNHQRAVNFFQETLLGNTCPWLAHECSDYESFQYGNCTSCGADNTACAYLGIDADQYASPERELVEMFLDTSDQPLFCRVHYVLEILTDDHEDAEDRVIGNFRINLYGSNGGVYASGDRITEKHESIYHGTVVRYLFIIEEEIGDTITVELEWNYNDTVNPGTWCGLFCNRSLYVKSIQVSPGSIYPESARVETMFLGCGMDGVTTEMKDGDVITFLQHANCAPVV